jgi:hypothetical protein
LDLVKQVPATQIEGTLRQGGLDDPAAVRSMMDAKAADRYGKIVDELALVTKQS